MLFRVIVKKYTAYLILLTKFEKIIGMKEKFVQNMEVPVSLTEFLLQNQGSFGGFFCFKFCILWWFLGEKDFRSSLFLFLGECVSSNLFPNVFPWMCFQFAFSLDDCFSLTHQVFFACKFFEKFLRTAFLTVGYL